MNPLSVVILSKNPDNLGPCLAAVLKHEGPVSIWVVWDGAWNVPWSWPNAPWSPVTIVQGDKPFVFARNSNIGIRAADRDDVILLNDDALLETPGGFARMQKAAEEHPEYGIIGATTDVTGQVLQYPFGGAPPSDPPGLREVPHIAFVCVLIPRRTIDLVGLLDERYCIDYGVEDRDYCEAVTRAGLKVGVHDGCFVNHSSLVSSFRGDPHTPKSFARNYALFKEKWGYPE